MKLEATTMQNDASSSQNPGIVYSFDVFDTCITRLHAFPRDLFYELGRAVAADDLDEQGKHRFARHFQAQRIRAEKRAHHLARPRQAVSIEEIYQQLSAPKGWTANDVMKMEVALERESIYIVPAAVARIQGLRDAGRRVIFISDMYLPSRMLGPILRELGVMKDGDALYVSCDVGLTKHHGDLFRHVLHAEGLHASQLIHTGDNRRADVRMAAHLGIEARYTGDAVLTDHEMRLAGRRLPRQRARSFHAAFTRRLRLSLPDLAATDQRARGQITQSVVVPFLITYVMWVLKDAKRSGLRRLYFVARDGQVLHLIALALQGDDTSIELRYLHGSRRAWQPASFVPDLTDLTRALLVAGQGSSRSDIAARLGLDESAQDRLCQILSCRPEQWSSALSHEESQAFLEQLQATPPALEWVHRSVQADRDAAIAYFSQQGLFDDASWALVDAGWSLNCQAALKRALETAGRPHQTPMGYYLALARGHLGEQQAGIAKAYVPEVGSIFSRRRVVVEHCFMPATHATTCKYNLRAANAEPVFGPEVRSEAELTYARELHEAAVAATMLAAKDKHMGTLLSEHAGKIRSAAERLLKNPTRAEAHAMGIFGTIADMRHEQAFVKPLCQALGFKDVITAFTMGLSREKNFQSPSYMWLEGSAALSPPHVRWPLRFLLLGDELIQRLKGRGHTRREATIRHSPLSK